MSDLEFRRKTIHTLIDEPQKVLVLALKDNYENLREIETFGNIRKETLLNNISHHTQEKKNPLFLDKGNQEQKPLM